MKSLVSMLNNIFDWLVVKKVLNVNICPTTNFQNIKFSKLKSLQNVYFHFLIRTKIKKCCLTRENLLLFYFFDGSKLLIFSSIKYAFGIICLHIWMFHSVNHFVTPCICVMIDNTRTLTK